MVFLIYLFAAAAFALSAAKWIRKHAVPLYFGAVLLAVTVIAGSAFGLQRMLPDWGRTWVWEPLVRGSLATSLFILVMYAGALPNGNACRKKLMSIRAELSILACILTLGHNLAYGQVHFVRLFTDPGSMPVNQMLAAICSVIMMAIMLPLFITSFPAVRRKMPAKRWKKLQRLAYGFYGLIYVHVLLLFVPPARSGQIGGIMATIIFSVIFLTYAVMRLRKAMKKNRWLPVAGAVAAAAAVAVLLLPAAAQTDESPVPSTQASATEGAAQTLPTEAASESAESTGKPTVPPATEVTYADGVYEGKGMGYSNLIYVQVTVEAGRIAAVEVTDHKEAPMFWNETLGLPDQIVKENSAEVDAVSGATTTSEGILDAVRDALSKAVG